jgi:hypothetical protein
MKSTQPGRRGYGSTATCPYMVAAAVALGIAIPVIFSFMRVGAGLWFDYQNRGA